MVMFISRSQRFALFYSSFDHNGLRNRGMINALRWNCQYVDFSKNTSLVEMMSGGMISREIVMRFSCLLKIAIRRPRDEEPE